MKESEEVEGEGRVCVGLEQNNRNICMRLNPELEGGRTTMGILDQMVSYDGHGIVPNVLPEGFGCSPTLCATLVLPSPCKDKGECRIHPKSGNFQIGSWS